MKKCFFLMSVTIMIFVSLIFSVSQVCAEGHALLIGVAEYPGFYPKAQLKGPVYDVSELKEKLIKSFGFASENIIVLINKDATRSNILQKLENLKNVTKPGDFVFLYFSGHGTGSGDWKNRQLGLEPYTGALVPYDFSYESDIAATMKKLIVSNRDIRPILEKLEETRQVFAVFDACYSGDSVKAILPEDSLLMTLPQEKLEDKYVPLYPFETDSQGKESEEQFEERAVSDEPPYPYQNTLYISAASRHEAAKDISDGRNTVDGKPHGAMTNEFLAGIDGAADTDHDGKITYNELYHYVRSNVSRKFGHTPQFLIPLENKALADQPVFYTKSSGIRYPDEKKDMQNKVLRVKLEKVDTDSEKKIAAIRGVKITDKDYDLLIAPKKIKDVKRTFFIYRANGSLLAEVAGTDEAVKRISLEVRNDQVASLSFSEQNFNVFAEIIGSSGVLTEGKSMGFDIRPLADSFILLININSKGGINVMYPCNKEELEPIKAGQTLNLPDIGKVTGPNFGTEYIKVIAFRNKPPLLEKFLNAEISSSDSRFSELMQMIQYDSKNSAQTILQVQTSKKSDIVRKKR